MSASPDMMGLNPDTGVQSLAGYALAAAGASAILMFATSKRRKK
ncbi:MAG: NPXTG-anchored protein [Oscillospiraceae bacterium]|nr:NPXTG-anchored protein [Oscillospiraceae bacterium]